MKEKPSFASIAVMIGSLLLAFALTLLGAFAQKAGAEGRGAVAALIAAGVLPVLIGAVSFIAARRFTASFNAKKYEDVNTMFRESREHAEKTAAEAEKKLRGLRVLVYSMAAAALLCGAAFAYLGGLVLAHRLAALAVLYSWVLILLGLVRLIPFRVPTGFMDENKAYIKKAEFPKLYSMAEAAAAAMGCTGSVRLALSPTGMIGVNVFNKTIVVFLDVHLLSVLSEEELKCIFRHEFSHVVSMRGDADAAYMARTGAIPAHLFGGLENAFYAYPDAKYWLEHTVNDFAGSVIREQDADRAMAACSTNEIAASALVKTKYYEYFEYEMLGKQIRHPFALEEPDRHEVSDRIALFKESIPERAEFRNGLISREILARNASHPTISMRLEALGIKEPEALETSGSPEYFAEVEKAVSIVDSIVYEGRAENYAEARKEQYLDHVRRLDEWKQEGEPLASETYRPIVDSMQELGRFSEADDLCKRVLSELPKPAHPYADFVLGYNMLHRFEDGGLDHLYNAIDGYSNLIDECLEQIGAYCIMTGKEDELERYRASAAELVQKQADVFSKLGELKRGDRLSKEELPEGVLEKDLAFFIKAGSGLIERIYLVRKTITEDFFTSVYVIKFEKDTPPARRNEIMDRIFNYLDTTTDWQYSLFEYEDAASVKIEAVEGSLVYKKE